MPEDATNKFGLINLPDIPDSVDQAFGNLTDSPTQNIGETLGDIWYLVFGGISQAAQKKRLKYAVDLKKYYQELVQAINMIPEDKRVEPSLQTTAQALENSKYCVSSDALREMFVKVITGSMHKDIEPHVHPAFPEILKQLSENDALVLKMFKSEDSFAIANIGSAEVKNDPMDLTDTVDMRYTDILSETPRGLSREICSMSVSSLVRAGLIRVSYIATLSEDSKYDPILLDRTYMETEEFCKRTGKKPHLQKGFCELTPLGKELVFVCVY